CWVDVWAVERLLERAESAADPRPSTRRAMDLFRGASLDGRGGEIPQMSALIDRLRRRLLRQLVRIGQQCAQAAQWQEAVEWYDEAIGGDPPAGDGSLPVMSRH